MRAKYFIYPYGPSNSARALADALGGIVLKRVGGKYRYKQGDVLINWGSSDGPYNPCVNKPESVRIGSSKLSSFAKFKAADVPTLEYTRDMATAQAWNTKSRVIGRDLDRGYAGRGITVYQPGAGVGQHSFYTKYIRKQREFRFHVYSGRIVRVLEKLKKNGADNADKYIRSHLNGWVFASHHLDARPYPEGLDRLALDAVRAVGLDFGGVDIGWNERVGGFVFEVNTAPGLEGESIPMYATVIKEIHGA